MATKQTPSLQQALVVHNKGPHMRFEVQQIPVPTVEADEVLVHLTWSGICHADIGFAQGEWDDLGFGLNESRILGHEGAGKVVQTGSRVTNLKPGDRVGIKWVRSVCHECIHCRSGNDNWCPSQIAYGKDVPGSFQSYVTAPANYLNTIPPELSDKDAAPLMCAGVTVYDALKRGNAKIGGWVAIFGAGGGLGHLAIQFAKAMKLNTIAIDHGEKRNLCTKLGADHFVDFTVTDPVAEVNQFLAKLGVTKTVVLGLVGSHKAYKQGFEMLGYGGVFVCVGLPAQSFEMPVSPIQMLTRGVTITSVAGSSVGIIQEALQFAAKHGVKPLTREYRLAEAEQALDDLKAHRVQGRAVLMLG